ncbi:hypothetical protein K523DRAFT_415537 [Schizophyllum commune Tattone D]|nr:hypothetical protein K525DRAFT_184852 [Schizophyllum commune Loenen D]KAI5830849.1 hypothetical protein K523DRAFT_415537 [Schizophyllum commune Tattone D]
MSASRGGVMAAACVGAIALSGVAMYAQGRNTKAHEGKEMTMHGDGPSPTGKGPGNVRGMTSAEVSDAVSHVPRPGERQEMKERAQQ